MKIEIKAEPEYGLVSKVGSIDLEYGVKGSELERELRAAQEAFLRSMDLRGLVLDKRVPQNPRWTTDGEGKLSATYAIDWEGVRRPKTTTSDGKEVELPNKKETSLEDTQGMVEYRIVGVFWAPKQAVEILKHREQIKDEERAKRNGKSFGYGGGELPTIPNYPGDDAFDGQEYSSRSIQKGPIENGNKADRADRRIVDDDTRRLSG
ncbi:MAG TPA: hypothetical protein ENH62_13895 [Marinobacter sp.]|uniref:Uncharacterized protein n=1 Tax=marine sediment metagenome TaxID=412755 RepID=A0A0F9SZU8_9ZZZZ|nr:hypothetical protein [Marinobacter sp.]